MDGHIPAAWRDIGAIDDIPVLGARTVGTKAGAIAVFRTADGQVFAVEDRCPHKAGKLSHGIVHGHSVTCPLHGWVISLESGHAAEPDIGCVRKISVKLEKDRILLAVGG